MGQRPLQRLVITEDLATKLAPNPSVMPASAIARPAHILKPSAVLPARWRPWRSEVLVSVVPKAAEATVVDRVRSHPQLPRERADRAPDGDCFATWRDQGPRLNRSARDIEHLALFPS